MLLLHASIYKACDIIICLNSLLCDGAGQNCGPYSLGNVKFKTK